MDHKKPGVSIGLPVFNGERYLEQAIESILMQTYTDFELIISDNASIDRTQEICQAYARQDKRIRYYRTERNMGAVPNFNRIFELSSSEFFKWAPYDDKIEPDFILKCIQALNQNPNAILCYTRANIIDETSSFVVEYDPGPDTSSLKGYERFRSLILRPEYAIQQMGVFRSAALRKTKLYGSFPSSDEVFLAELALLGEFYELPERLYLYRRHGAQSTAVSKARSRMLFFDTSFNGKIILPKWAYFMSCLEVIQRSSKDWNTRIHCYMTMVLWLLIPSNFRAMGKDLLLALVQVIKRAFSFISGSGYVKKELHH